MPDSDRPMMPRISLAEFAQLASGIKLAPWQARILDELDDRRKAGQSMQIRWPSK